MSEQKFKINELITDIKKNLCRKKKKVFHKAVHSFSQLSLGPPTTVHFVCLSCRTHQIAVSTNDLVT